MALRSLMFLAALGVSACAFAGAESEDKPMLDVAAFLDTQEEIAAQASGGDFGFMKPSEMRELKTAQSVLHRHLSGVSSIEELDDEAKVAVYNAQQKVNAIITQDRSEEVRCERVQRTGSRFSDTRCYTAEQLAEQRKAAERLQRSAISIPCGGGDSAVCGQANFNRQRGGR
jgi:hypothetical protein